MHAFLEPHIPVRLPAARGGRLLCGVPETPACAERVSARDEPVLLCVGLASLRLRDDSFHLGQLVCGSRRIQSRIAVCSCESALGRGGDGKRPDSFRGQVSDVRSGGHR